MQALLETEPLLLRAKLNSPGLLTKIGLFGLTLIALKVLGVGLSNPILVT